MAPTPERRNAPPPRLFSMSREFLKDWTGQHRSGQADMQDVKDVMLRLIGGETLPEANLDHQMKSAPTQRGCHIKGDLVMLYTPGPKGGVLEFNRLGSHNQVFSRS